MDRPTGRERRQHPRAVVSWPVIIVSSRGLMAGETKDISHTGAFISCREPLEPNEVLEMSISVSLLSPRIQAMAEVVWSNHSSSDEEFKPRGMGVRFTKIETTDHEMISALVADHLDIKDQDRPGEDLIA